MKTDAELANPGMPAEERIARIVARALGHNNDGGTGWQRYVCVAALILRECRVAFAK